MTPRIEPYDPARHDRRACSELIYGAEGAVAAINAFFLKHRMIVADRGVSGIAYGRKEITEDGEALDAADRLAERILELGRALHADGA